MMKRFNQAFTSGEWIAITSGLELRIDQLKQRIQEHRQSIEATSDDEVSKEKYEKRFERCKRWLEETESALAKLDDYSSLFATDIQV
jgi:hypothetical protein